MTTALEEFTVALARTSKSGYRHLRGMSRADAEDVLSIAVVWCWENRDQFDAKVGALDDWFAERVRQVARGRNRDNWRELARRSYRALEQLERLSPGRSGAQRVTSDRSTYGKPPIDHEIERLLRRPRHERADCPSCWRCRWYDGLTPGAWQRTRFASAEVEEAVYNIERRKIEIAGANPTRLENESLEH